MIRGKDVLMPKETTSENIARDIREGRFPQRSEPIDMEPARDPIETLRSDAAFLRHYLANYIVSVQTKDERGHVVNSFAAVQIPDWAVKQRLDDIDASIEKFAGVSLKEEDWEPPDL